jgi:hypothetical protein
VQHVNDFARHFRFSPEQGRQLYNGPVQAAGYAGLLDAALAAYGMLRAGPPPSDAVALESIWNK